MLWDGGCRLGGKLTAAYYLFVTSWSDWYQLQPSACAEYGSE